MTTVLPYLTLLAKGTLITCSAWLITLSASSAIGLVLGIMSCKHFAHTGLNKPIRFYTFIAKGIPAYVQILIAYFVLPSALGINISGFTAACSALAFCSSGYITEIIRAGMNAIPKGQWDACFVLGYPLHATLRRIIMPQVFRIIVPALFGESEQLLKSTSLLATIGVTELTRTGMNIISRELNPFAVYGVIAFIYLCFSAFLQLVLFILERKMRYGNH